jgi:DNA-binding response OmpR family regulator
MMRILIVDDDARISRALQVRLNAEGYETVVAADAVTGASMAARQHPDLVLLDIMMPLAGGLGGGLLALKRLRKAADTAAIPVIIMTASKAPSLRKRAMELGASAFLEKPFDTGDLLDAISTALARSRDAVRRVA